MQSISVFMDIVTFADFQRKMQNSGDVSGDSYIFWISFS